MKNPPLNIHPLIFWNDHSDWMAIHRFHARQTWRRAGGALAKTKLLLKSFLWPFRVIGKARRKTRAFGKEIERHTGKSEKRQWAEQLFLCFFQGHSPKAYYLFELYLPANRKRAQQYLHRYETKDSGTLYRTISPDYKAGARFMNRKARFHKRCLENGIPTAPVHMTIEAGPGRTEDGEVKLPRRDLFIKPAVGKGGKGAQIWWYRDDDTYQNTEGLSLEGTALLEQLRLDAADGALLVQSRLENHADLSALCGRVFSTARIMTVLDEGLEPEVTTAVFRMANESAVVDNIHCGGLAAPVDLATGILGSAQSLSPDAMRVDAHPRSGEQIKGCKLPHWDEAKNLAVRAHKAMPGTALIGWDIGFTEDGPVLVEGNSAPCVHLLQRGAGAPLGGTRFAELIAFHLARVQSTDLPGT